MKQNMILRGFSSKTQYAYLSHVRFFENFFERPLESMGTPEIKEFLHYCITKKNVSRSYANLKISDIDSHNMQVIIRLAKGRVDRYSLLSQTNLEILRLYYRTFRPKLWLFPGSFPDKPIHPRSIQRVFEESRDKAGIIKKASVHSLRHSFATHLLEEGVNVVYIEQLLGHASITITLRYLHLVRVKILKIASPLDL